jgi:hypothetical protein
MRRSIPRPQNGDARASHHVLFLVLMVTTMMTMTPTRGLYIYSSVDLSGDHVADNDHDDDDDGDHPASESSLLLGGDIVVPRSKKDISERVQPVPVNDPENPEKRMFSPIKCDGSTCIVYGVVLRR